MSQPARQICSECQRTVPVSSRFCPYCGTAIAQRRESDEIVILGGKHLRISHDTLDVRALLDMVESSVAWWQQHQRSTSEVNREHAAAAIKELSKILDSLSQQLAQGRETMRITTRLPTTRIYTLGCPVCGHGNRSTARFCKACGSLLPDIASSRPASAAQPATVRLTIAARSDRGQVRANNEDTCYVGTLTAQAAQPVTVLLVADGMGGAQAGEDASRLASDTARQTLANQVHTRQPTRDEEWHKLLGNAVRAANEQVYARSASDRSYAGMGTTLTLLVVAGARLHLAHVGDSRAYLGNAAGVTEDGARLMQLTTDHSLVARLVDIGQLTPAEARTHPQRNVIYRTLGAQPTIEVDTSSQPLDIGDRLLLCSDGLVAHLDDADLARLVLSGQQAEPICEQLMALANQRGGSDNISVVVAMIEGIEHHVPL